MLIGAKNAAPASGRPNKIALATGASLTVVAILRLFGIGLLPRCC